MKSRGWKAGFVYLATALFSGFWGFTLVMMGAIGRPSAALDAVILFGSLFLWLGAIRILADQRYAGRALVVGGLLPIILLLAITPPVPGVALARLQGLAPYLAAIVAAAILARRLYSGHYIAMLGALLLAVFCCGVAYYLYRDLYGPNPKHFDPRNVPAFAGLCLLVLVCAALSGWHAFRSWTQKIS